MFTWEIMSSLLKNPNHVLTVSWLFPDCLRIQLTVVWLNLSKLSQTVNGLKAKNIKLPQINFFSWKTTNNIFMYLLATFILQNFKKNS